MPNRTGLLQQFSASIRAKNWWQYKVPPLLGFTYLFININHIPFIIAGSSLLVFLIAIIGIAGSGYVINDLYDIPSDQAAGKINSVAGLSNPQRAGLFIILLSATTIPWLWLPFDRYTIIMIVTQFSLYLLYSHPLTRLKEKHLWGVICDALYGHIIPALVAMHTFQMIGKGLFLHFHFFIGTTFTWLFLKGTRNIILHQVEDRKNDRVVGLETFVLCYGPLPSLQLLNNVVLPVELILAGIWLWLLALNLPLFGVILCGFLLAVYFKFSGWKLEFLPHRQLRFKFLYFLNDFYEVWLPLLAVIYFPFTDAWMLVFVIIHLLLFPNVMVKLTDDIKVIRKNIRQGMMDERDRMSYFDH